MATSRTMMALRTVVMIGALVALVYLCLQTDRARLKGTPMETWRVVPLILSASVAGLLGKRFINSISGLFLAGIGGALGTGDHLAGPYGGVVGLLIGVIVVCVPIMHKPAPDTHCPAVGTRSVGG